VRRLNFYGLLGRISQFEAPLGSFAASLLNWETLENRHFGASTTRGTFAASVLNWPWLGLSRAFLGMAQSFQRSLSRLTE
jgi:hypothetical protein